MPADPFHHDVGSAFHLHTEGGIFAILLDVFELYEESALRGTGTGQGVDLPLGYGFM